MWRQNAQFQTLATESILNQKSDLAIFLSTFFTAPILLASGFGFTIFCLWRFELSQSILIYRPRSKVNNELFFLIKTTSIFFCSDTYYFNYLFFSFNFFFFFHIHKKKKNKKKVKYCWVWSSWCEALGTLFRTLAYIFQELNLNRIGIFISNITVTTLNNLGNGQGVVGYTYF